MFSPLRMIKTLTFVLLRIFWCGRSMETWTEEAFIFFNLTFIYSIINVYFNSGEAISDPCMRIYFWWFEGFYLSQWWWTKDDESDWNPFFKILMTIEAFVWEVQYLPLFSFLFLFYQNATLMMMNNTFAFAEFNCAENVIGDLIWRVINWILFFF